MHGNDYPSGYSEPKHYVAQCYCIFFFFFFNEGTFLKQRAQVSFVLRNFRNYFYLVNELNSLVNIIQNDKTLYSERFISELTYCFGLRIYLPTFGAHYYFLFFFFLLTYKNKCQWLSLFEKKVLNLQGVAKSGSPLQRKK